LLGAGRLNYNLKQCSHVGRLMVAYETRPEHSGLLKKMQNLLVCPNEQKLDRRLGGAYCSKRT